MITEFKLPLVSIGIPVYNGETTIKKLLESVLNQSYENIEVIISDNLSNDSTPNICNKYKKNDKRINYIRQKNNIGISNNFNFVFNNSGGKYFIWAADDDFFEKEFIEKCVEKMEANPKAALCNTITNQYVSGFKEKVCETRLDTFIKKKNFFNFFKEVLFNFPATAIYGLYRAEFVKKTDLWKNTFSGDLIFILQLALLGNFVQVEKNLFNYVSKNKWKSKEQDYYDFYGKYKIPLFFSPFFNIIISHFKNILKSELTFFSKLRLLFILHNYILYKILTRFLLKINKNLFPKKMSIIIGEWIYWKFIYNKNIKITEPNIYYERFIKPQIGIFL